MGIRTFARKVRTPSALALAALLISWSAATALAQDASVVYLEGEPELRGAQGTVEWLDFGTSLRAGESVVTGRNDFVELEQGAASTIEVLPDTVFTIREVERGGERRTVMTNSAGAVKYRFNRLTGRHEPDIGTSSVVAGVRGTEVTVYAGADGSSLFLVDSGEVEVTSSGQSVSLTQNEGVEVPAGGPPGEKFEFIGRAVDFSEWNADKSREFLDNPADVLQGVADQLQLYYTELDQLRELYSEARTRYDEKYTELEDAVETHGRESAEADALREEVSPLGNEATILAFNIRYYALTALSLRRYVAGQMYMEMKTRYILDRDNSTYQHFVEVFDEIVSEYEQRVTGDLVAVDI